MLKRASTLAIWLFAHPVQGSWQLPRIFLNRLSKNSPLSNAVPWMPFLVIQHLNHVLKPTDRVLEFGSGGSTLFLARRVSTVVTIEHDPQWGALVQAALKRHNLTQVDFRVVPPEAGHNPAATSAVAAYQGMNFTRYLQQIQDFADESFDVVIIDGRVRNQCVEAALPKLKPGGLLVLDNADRAKYAPSLQRLQHLPSTYFYGLNPYQFDPGGTMIWVNAAALPKKS